MNEFKIKKGLIVTGEGGIIVDIQGQSGQLFSVTDSLVGVLMSVNDISGLPILEVSSDNTVKMGTFGLEGLIVSGSTVILPNTSNLTGDFLTIGAGNVIGKRTAAQVVTDLGVAANTNTVTLNGTANQITITGTATQQIGSNPSWTLSLPSVINVPGGSTSDSALQLGHARTGNGNSYIDFVGDTTYTDYGLRIIRGSTGANANSAIAHRGTGDLSIQTIEASNMTFLTSSVERMRITASGAVGIGASIPRGDVSIGTITSESAVTKSIHLGYSVLNFYGYRIINTNTATSTAAGLFAIQRGTTSAWVDSFSIINNGNVGIGTSSPVTKLEINGDIGIGRVAGGYTFREVVGGGERAGIKSNALNELIFNYGASTEGMRINTFGNVGIGTASPGGKFEINHTSAQGATSLILKNGESVNANGTIRWRNSSDTNLAGIGSNYNVSDNGAIEFLNGNTTNMIIRSTGNVGIGTTSPSAPLDTNGVRIGRNFSLSNRATVRLDSVNTSSPSDILFGHTAAANESSWNGVYWSLSSRASEDSNKFHIYRGPGNPGGSGEGIIMTLQPNGNVGIGTTSPTSNLHISGNSSGIKIQNTLSTLTDIVQIDLTGTVVGSGTGNERSILFGVSATAGRQAKIAYGQGSSNGQLPFLSFWTGDNTSLLERMRISSTGALRLNSYGSGTFTGTATQRLAVDTNGNVIEIPIGSGPVDGNGTTNFVTKWSDTDTITNSIIFDNGTNVGIGTTSPLERLHVSGRIISDQLIEARGINNPATGKGLSLAYNASTDIGLLRSRDWDAGAFRGLEYQASLHSFTSGNVGIGTTNATALLTLRSSGNTTIRFEDGGTTSVGSITRTPSTALEFVTSTTSRDFIFRENSNELMRIMGTGNVGIGTSSPGQPLEVFKNSSTLYAPLSEASRFPTASQLYLRNQNTNDGTFSGVSFEVQRTAGINSNAYIGAVSNPNNPHIVFGQRNGNTTQYIERMRINSEGNVGIGTTSPSFKLQVTGNSNFGDGIFIHGGGNALTTYYDQQNGAYLHTPTVMIRRDQTRVIPAEMEATAVLYNRNGTDNTGTKLVFANNESTASTANPIATAAIVSQKVSGTAGAWGNGNLTFLVKSGSAYTTIMTMLANGNVGIGTTNPTRILTISRLDTTGGVTSSQTSVIRLNNPTSAIGAYTGIQFGYNTNAPDGQVHASIGTVQDSTDSSWTGRLAFAVKANAGFGVLTEYMSIITGGNVGIGTTAPGAKLQIASNSLGGTLGNQTIQTIFSTSNANSSLLEIKDVRTSTGTDWTSAAKRIQMRVDSTYMGYIQFNGTGNNSGISFGAGSTTTAPGDVAEHLRITAGGLVGIGVTNPAAKLNIVSANDTTALRINAGPSAIYNFTANSTSGYETTFNMNNTGLIIGHNSNSRSLSLTTASTSRIFITGDGLVGIGTTDPSERLHVVGRARIATMDNAIGNFVTTSATGVLTQRSAAQVRNDIQVSQYSMTSSTSWVAASTSGWFRLASTSSQNRGGIRIIISYTGGNFAPETYIINANKDWQTTGSLRVDVRSTVTSWVRGVRIIQDIVNTSVYHIEANFASSSNPHAFQLYSNNTEGFNDAWTVTTTSPLVASTNGTVITLVNVLGSGVYSSDPYNIQNIKIDTNTISSRDTNGHIILSPNGTGNVGIGTTTPAEKLRVNGTFSSNAIWTNTANITNWGAYPTVYGILTWNTGVAVVRAASGNILQLGANGSSHMTISTDGNVGIGTTSPSVALDVNGTINGGFLTISRAGTSAVFTDTRTNIHTEPPSFKVQNTGDTSVTTLSHRLVDLDYAGDADIVTGTYVRFLTAGTERAGLGLTSDKFTITTGVAERLTIDASGNVGIGTTSPAKNLDVFQSTDGATIRISSGQNDSSHVTSTPFGILEFYSADVSSPGAGVRSSIGSYPQDTAASGGANLIFNNSNSGGIYEAMRITAAGNLGIGTTNPSQRLSVRGGTISAGATDSQVAFLGADGSNVGYVGTITNHPFQIRTNSTNRWTIGTDGIFESTGAQTIRTSTGNLTLATNGGNGNILLTPNGTGNVGIGTTTPTHRLDVNGRVRSSNESFTSGDGAFIAGGGNPGIVQRLQRTGGGYAYSIFQGFADNSTTGLSSFILDYGVLGSLESGVTSPTISYAFFSVGTNSAFNNTHMRIYNDSFKTISIDGRLGIGTTSPEERLHVNGNARLGTDPTLSWVSNTLTLVSSTNAISVVKVGGTASHAPRFEVWSAADTVKVAQIGSSGTFFNTGNVGIGTTIPSSIFDANTSGDNNSFITVRQSGAGTTSVPLLSGILFRATSSNHAKGLIASENKQVNTWNSDMVFYTINVAAGAVSDLAERMRLLGVVGSSPVLQFNGASTIRTSTGALTLATNAGNGHIILSPHGTGNVGIGTTSPASNLHVVGSARVVVNSGAVGDTLFGAINGVSNGYRIQSDSNNNITYSWNTGSNTTAMRINNDGNVGIGTTTPSTLLHVANLTQNNSAYQHIQYVTANNSNEASSGESYTSSSSSFGIGFRRQWQGSTFTNIAGIYGFGSSGWRGGMLFRTKNNTTSTGEPDIDALFLSPAGNVGIGTTTPSTFAGGGLTLGTNTVGKNIILNSSADGNNGLLQFIDLNSNNSLQIGGGTTQNSLYGYGNRPMVFFTNDTERMRITAGGNVGINNTTPTTRLQIHGAGSDNNFRGVIRIINSSTAQWSGLAFPDGVSVDTSANNFYFIGRGASLASRELSFHIPTTTDYGSGAQPRFLFASTGADTLMTLQAVTGNAFIKGNVGIGTTNPSFKLDVNGDIYANGDIRSQGTFRDYQGEALISTNTSAITNIGSSGAGTPRQLAFFAGNAERMRIASAGNVLMNTTVAPTTGGFTDTTLSVKQVADGLFGGGIQIEESATTSVAYFGFNGSTFRIGTSYRTTGDYRPISFATSGLERLRIANDGNVGIGTTNPLLHSGTTGLVVRGSARGIIELWDATAGKAVFQQVGGDTYIGSLDKGTGTGDLIFLVNGSGTSADNAAMIKANGNFGIGTTSPSRRLHVVGSEWDNSAGGGVIFENSSTVGASLTLKPSASVVTNGSNGWAVYAGGPGAAIGDGNLGFWAHGTNAARLVIQRGGFVGINENSPSERLHVSGRARITTIDNAVGNFITTSATGVLTQRTAVEVRGDIGASSRFANIVTVSNTAFTYIATVSGNSLASAIRATFQGTSNSVVVNVVADILVNHFEDIQVTTTSTYYIQLEFRIISNNNDTFSIEARVIGSNPTPLNIEIFPLNDESVNFGGSAQTGTQLTFQTIPGVLIRGADGSTATGAITATVGTFNGNVSLRAAATTSAVTQIPVFIADPASTTRTLVTRTPAQLRGDIGAQALLTNPITGTGSAGQVSFWTDTTTQSGDNALWWDNTNKRLGIGITTPQSRLDVITPANGYVSFGTNISVGQFSGIHFGYRENNTNYRKSAIVFERTDAAPGGGNNAAGKVHILNGPSTGAGSATLADSRLTINEVGNVGIGTTSPSERLHVSGRARITTINDGVGDFVTVSGTGVLTKRTATQTISDINGISNATDSFSSTDKVVNIVTLTEAEYATLSPKDGATLYVVV
jgi:hypothetical protein